MTVIPAAFFMYGIAQSLNLDAVCPDFGNQRVSPFTYPGVSLLPAFAAT